MNLAQLILKARRNADAILPTNQVSALWGDDEMADLATEANEEINLRFQAVHKKWGLQTVTQSDPAFTRDGETYTPSTALKIRAQTDSGGNPIAPRILLPPDFGEMVRILCVSNRTIRFLPAPIEWGHYIDLEQGSYSTQGQNVIPSTPDGLTFYYDIIDNRTMIVIPATTQSFNIAIDYIPQKRPLYFTSLGTVTLQNGLTSVMGNGTNFVSAGVYSEASNQACELIVPITNTAAPFQDSAITVMQDYARVAAITSDTALTLKSPWAGSSLTAQPYLLCMVPTLPRTYHRWISRLVATYMLSKASPQLAQEYSQGVLQKFAEVVQPTARVRQSQESPVTEDSEEFGVTSEF